MHSHRSRFVRSLMTAVFAAAFAAPLAFSASAPQHLVSPSQLQQSAVNASQARQRNIKELHQFLSLPQAKKAFQQAGIDPDQVKNAVSGLSDQELANLSARAQKAQRDFSAGAISNEELIIILLGVILIIVLVIVA